MSIWARITEALRALASGESLASLFDFGRTPPEKSVAFTIAVIALGAKMAKADGQVTRDEVVAFREVFQISAADEAQAARVFNLARQDVAGFDVYARKIARMFGPGADLLTTLVEGLFHMAMADGEYDPAEDEFIAEVARIFGLGEKLFACLRARYVPGAEPDPLSVLGAPDGADLAEIRKIYRRLVRENHPDAMIAKGLPEEAIALANTRLATINRAWEEVQQRMGALA